MSKKPTSKIEEELRKDAEITKQIALAEAKKWLDTIPKERHDEPLIVVGTRSFTPRQILEEIEQDTEHGKEIGQMLKRMRIELAKEGEKREV